MNRELITRPLWVEHSVWQTRRFQVHLVLSSRGYAFFSYHRDSHFRVLFRLTRLPFFPILTGILNPPLISSTLPSLFPQTLNSSSRVILTSPVLSLLLACLQFFKMIARPSSWVLPTWARPPQCAWSLRVLNPRPKQLHMVRYTI